MPNPHNPRNAQTPPQKMKRLPIYCGINVANEPKFIAGQSHAGLWFNRFFDQYDQNWQVIEPPKSSDRNNPKNKGGKLNWINTLAGKIIGDTNALKGWHNNQKLLVNSLNGQYFEAFTEGFLATGLGNPHPVENGFAFHHTLGVPYLSGAAVKGLLRAYCTEWANIDEDPKKANETLIRWFGPSEDDIKEKIAPEQAGQLIFFDALPAEPIKLKAEVMTPHYGDWYEKGGEDSKKDGSNIPADWHSPMPIPFLVVDRGQPFRFYVASRNGKTEDLDKITGLLQEALSILGSGAKTATGYGRMEIKSSVSQSSPIKASNKPAEVFVKKSEKLEGKASWTPNDQSIIFTNGKIKATTRSDKLIKEWKSSCPDFERFKKKGMNVVCEIETQGNLHQIIYLTWHN